MQFSKKRIHSDIKVAMLLNILMLTMVMGIWTTNASTEVDLYVQAWKLGVEYEWDGPGDTGDFKLEIGCKDSSNDWHYRIVGLWYKSGYDVIWDYDEDETNFPWTDLSRDLAVVKYDCHFKSGNDLRFRYYEYDAAGNDYIMPWVYEDLDDQDLHDDYFWVGGQWYDDQEGKNSQTYFKVKVSWT